MKTGNRVGHKNFLSTKIRKPAQDKQTRSRTSFDSQKKNNNKKNTKNLSLINISGKDCYAPESLCASEGKDRKD